MAHPLCAEALPGTSGAESRDLSGSLRLKVSSTDGFSSLLKLAWGQAQCAFSCQVEPGEAPSILLGLLGPLFVAGPVREVGLARLFSDPCADPYLLTGNFQRPLALDMEGSRRGIAWGDAAGVWALRGEVPRIGIWAGSTDYSKWILGGEAACSILPGREALDTWFSDEPALPRRLLAVLAVWTGYNFQNGKILVVGARSEEDRGGRGWSLRGEGEYLRKGFRWNGRFSCASPDWTGLEGDGADPWELRSDCSWLLPSRLRLEGRIRTGATEGGCLDWEGLARVSWAGEAWRLKAALEGSDAEEEPYFQLEPEICAEYSAKGVRASLRCAALVENAELGRMELSPVFVLGREKSPSLRLEGAYRWEPGEDAWKARAHVDIPAGAGSFTVSVGTEDWVPRSERAAWEAEAVLRACFP